MHLFLLNYYQLAIMQLKSEGAKVQYNLELEMGKQRVAHQEFDILGQKVTETEKRLMLREPQLEIQKATPGRSQGNTNPGGPGFDANPGQGAF